MRRARLSLPSRAPSRAAAGAALACAAALVGAHPARAALLGGLGPVAVLAPDPRDPVIAETASRLRSELAAVGLGSAPIGCDSAWARDARACAAARGGAPAAAADAPPAVGALISLGREDGVVTIEVVERLPDGEKFFRLVYVPAAAGGDDPAVMAVRGVELLRDVHMDVERTEAPPRTGAPAPPAVTSSVGPTKPGPGPWRVAATAGMLQGRGGLGPRVAPALAVARALGPHLSAALLAAGPFFQELSPGGGSVDAASTRQELALLALRIARAAGRVRPFGALSAGALHLSADGHTGDSTAVVDQPSLWSLLLGAGAGATCGLTARFALVAEADLLVAMPSAAVTIRGATVGKAGAPSYLFQLGLAAALP